MEIADACRTIRCCNDAFLAKHPLTVTQVEVGLAVRSIKHYIEKVRADGKPIRELQIADHLLCTPEAIHWVMPFVLSAEEMLAHERRKQMT